MDNVSFSAYLDLSRISLQSDVSSEKRVFELLGELLATDLAEISATHISEGLVARERLGTTALGAGMAIPHCRVDHLEKIRCAIIKLDHPVDFDAQDDQPVSFICALLVPSEADNEHLQALASLAEFLSDQVTRETLISAQSAQEILDIFIQKTDKNAA